MASTPRTTTLTEQQSLGEALKRLRQRAGLSQEQAAERAEIVEITWRRYEKGVRGVTLDKLIGLAMAIGFDRDALLMEQAAVAGGSVAPPTARGHLERMAAYTPPPGDAGLVIRDRVQAGNWLEADDTGQSTYRTYPAVRDARYPHADQWLSEVMGDSVNRLNIFEGDMVHLVDCIAIGYHPRTDDVVEVERLRNGGAERELTIKQIELVQDGLLLWPRSTNTRWSQPLELRDGAGDGEEIEVRIRGLVIGLHRRFG
ncbi:Helix-turn-helix domain protein [Brevundimonas sp. BAL3]|uniref:helix-turn-helix domain-containing protein n=1 Tax=Brevundimonas sp. BAL3 TaxID=391600 RepID=UPI00017EBEA7|nr:LexA family transcriptional regulator [Brevundimonas sp. BAL3]EDX80493.1 Helix-turn-helix domain protein [Brevundimonas sp. BAL3]